jgi:hypothetical protein
MLVHSNVELLFASAAGLLCPLLAMLTGSYPNSGRQSLGNGSSAPVSRGDREGIPWLAGKRRLAGEDGIGIECVGRRRGDARLSEEGPELRGRDDRVGRQGQVVKAAARIESVIETSQASDGADAQEFSTNLVMRNIGDDDNRAGCQDGLQPCETSDDMRLAGSADDQAERPTVQQDQPRDSQN